MKAKPICSPFQIAPRSLLVSDRLDIAIKWRFFRHLLKRDDPDSERIYRWHIKKRTRGREPRSWKRSIDDYVTACKTLLRSMQRSGFDPKQPLEYGSNWQLRNGAHRLACSLLLELNVYCVLVSVNGGTTWGANWFRLRGMSLKDLERIEMDWDRINIKEK